jgi:integrase/recombinase XerD
VLTLDKVIEDFLAHKEKVRGRAPKTIETYRGTCRMFREFVSVHKGHAYARHFTREMVEAWVTRMSDRQLDTITIINRLAALRELAKYGTRQRIWATDPFLDIEPLRRPRRLPRPFTAPDRDALMALELNDEDTALRAILYYGGLRAEEVTRLRIRDVEPPPLDGYARLRVRGKGSKERALPMHPDAWAAIEAFLLAKPGEDRKPAAFLFMHDDGAPWTTKMVQRRMTSWGLAAGIEKCTAHRWRHTHATNLLHAGQSLPVIQRRLGHASLNTTQMYLGVSDAEQDAAAASLPSFILRRDSRTAENLSSRPDDA